MKKAMIAAVALLLMGASAAVAQAPPALELRGGVGIPVEDLGASSLKAGPALGGTLSVPLYMHIRAYAGWDWARFVTDEPFAGGSFDVENTGYAFGIALQHPLVGGRIDGWLKGGGVYQHIELEDDAGDIVADSGHELGWEAAAGLFVPVMERFAFTPGVRYRTFSADLVMGSTTHMVDMSYVAAELGIVFSFGARPGTAARTR